MRYALTIIFLLIANISVAGTVNVTVGQPTAGVTEPASGTVLIGTSDTSTAAIKNPTANRQYFWDLDSTASWTESASTTTVGTMEWYVRGWDGGNCKSVLHNSDGTIVTNGVSNALAISYEGSASWHSFTMGTPPTVTKGNNYRMSITCSGGTAVVYLYYNDSGTQTFGDETSGNYTTPVAVTSPADIAIDSSATFTNVRCKK